jgi:hypothetical protein
MGQFTLKNDLIFHNVILGCLLGWILKSRRPEQGSQKFVLWIYFLCFLDFKRTGIYLCTGKTLRPFWIGASNLAFSHTILSIWKQINLGCRGAGAEFEGAQLQGRRFSDADLSLGYSDSLTFNVWHYIYECHVDMASIWWWHGCDMPCGILCGTDVKSDMAFMWHLEKFRKQTFPHTCFPGWEHCIPMWDCHILLWHMMFPWMWTLIILLSFHVLECLVLTQLWSLIPIMFPHLGASCSHLFTYVSCKIKRRTKDMG